MRWMRRIAIGAVGLYAAVVALLYVYQRDLMYRPDSIKRVPPSYYDMLTDVQEVELKTPDGLRVLAWYAPAPEGRPTVLVFHGNGGSLRSQRYRLKYFKDANMGVMILGYRGYAGSDGAPSEEGLYTDARTAIAWLNENGVADNRLVLYGESLGTGVATKMATEHEVAAESFWFVPVHWLMTDQYNSLARIADVHEPILIMHGAADQVIPQALGRKLFDAANEPKESFWPEIAAHNTIFDLGGFTAAADFIERHVK